MTPDCLVNHKEHVKEYPNGIWICLRCAAKREMAQSIKTAQAKMSMLEGPQMMNLDLLLKPSDGSMSPVAKCKCLRCADKHEWESRVPNPKRCPACKSPYWNKPYIRKEFAEWREQRAKLLKS